MLRQTGHRIAAARSALGLTQEDASDRSGIDYKRWQRLEAGQVNPTIKTLVRVAEALEIDVWVMLEGKTRRR